jgi:hypothetical protein
MILLAICVGAVLIGALRMVTARPSLPAGSSYSTQPDGAMGLYLWAQSLGTQTARVGRSTSDSASRALVVLQPETPVNPQARAAFDAVPEHGGTLVLAGDSLAWVVYARTLGVTAEPVEPELSEVATPDGLRFRLASRYRLRAPGAEPLLVRDNGDWAGLRLPYKQGALIVLASPGPLTNAGLRDDQAARFVFRQILMPAQGGTLGFDEVDHSYTPAASDPNTLGTLVFATSGGRAVVYAGLVLFMYLLLSGRRLGPALVPRPSTEADRTMFEHVQMLANLYRRAGQTAVVKDAFARRYARSQARATPGSKRAAAFAEARARVQAARSESELVAAVAAVDDAG